VGVKENYLISSKMELIGLSWVCHGNFHSKEVNNYNHFEALKLSGTIEWEQVNNFSKNLILLFNVRNIFK